MIYEFSAFATMESGNTMRKDKTQMSLLRNLSEKLVAKLPATRLRARLHGEFHPGLKFQPG